MHPTVTFRIHIHDGSPFFSFPFCKMCISPMVFVWGLRDPAWIICGPGTQYRGCFSNSHFPYHYWNIWVAGSLKALWTLNDMMIHISLWIISLWGLMWALFAVAGSSYCLSSIMPCTAWARSIFTPYIQQNWGLVTLWSGKGFATEVINLFWNFGDYIVHRNNQST